MKTKILLISILITCISSQVFGSWTQGLAQSIDNCTYISHVTHNAFVVFDIECVTQEPNMTIISKHKLYVSKYGWIKK